MSSDLMLNPTYESNNDLFCNNFMHLTLSSSSGGTSTSSTPASATQLTQPSSTKADTSTSGTLAQPPISEKEIRAVLLQKAPVTTSDLVHTFKARLNEPKDKRAFAKLLKRISKIQRRDNKNYVVLRNHRSDTSTSSTPASVKPPLSTKASTSTSGTPSQGPISEEEVRAVLLQKAPVTTFYLVHTFKARLKTPQDKMALADILKSIADIKRSNNKSYIVLR